MSSSTSLARSAGLIGIAAVQINVSVNTYLATGQPQGAVSWFSYAFRLMYLPIGLFGVSLATAALPGLRLALAIGAGLLILAATARALRLAELSEALDVILRRRRAAVPSL